MNSAGVSPLFSFPARHRLLVLMLLLLVTGWLASKVMTLTLQPGFLNELPQNHPFSATYRQYNPQFGGGNVVVIALEQPGGDIYTAKFMTALGDLTQRVLKIRGVDPSTVRSLFTGNVTYREVTAHGYDGARIIPRAYNGSAQQVEEIRANIDRSREIGRSVALNQDGALIRFELAELDSKSGDPLDYAQVGLALDEIRNTFEAEGLEVRIIGFAPFVLAVIDAVKNVLLLMAASLLILFLLIAAKTRRLGAALAITAAPALAVVWQLGLMAMLGRSIDPLSMLTPFLLYLFGVAIAWQLTSFWQSASGSIENGCANLLSRGAAPATVAIVVLAGGLALNLNSDVPLVTNFVTTGLLGLVTLWAALMLALPNFLSWLAPSSVGSTVAQSGAPNVASGSGRLLTLMLILLALGVGLLARGQVRIGDDLGSGATQLSVDSRYNRDVDAILADYRFGVDQLTLVAKSGQDGCLEFDVLHTIDRLIWQLRDLPEVRSVYALPVYMKLSSIGHHEGFLRFYGFARQARGNTVNTWGTELRDKLYDQKCGEMPIRVFPVNHAEVTLRKIITVAEQFAQQNDQAPVSFEFAIGNAAIRAAANDRVPVVESNFLLSLALLAVAAMGLFSFNLRSGGRALLLLVVSASGMYPVLWLLDQGLNLSVLPTVMVALGWSLVAAAFASFANSSSQVGQISTNAALIAVISAIALLPWGLAELRYQSATGLLLGGVLLWIGLVSRWLVPRLWRPGQTTNSA